MNEYLRLQELENYQIMDTAPENELDELVEIASAILETPISLISLIDAERQWFKVNKGLSVSQTPRGDGFCPHVLHTPKEVLVVEDSLKDDRFRNSPLVLGDPKIRFYAGAPLETPNGHILGTLCVIDNKPRKISNQQKRALQLIAKKVMDFLNTRKRLLEQEHKIGLNAVMLKKLTDQAPGAIFQYKMAPDGRTMFPFMSKGIEELHPQLDPAKFKMEPEIAFKSIHPEDLQLLLQNLEASREQLKNWDMEFRVVSENSEDEKWHWVNAKPERQEDGSVVWHGIFQDITHRKEHIKALEQILFDISHVMRRPVSTLLGLVNAIEAANPNEDMLKQFMEYIKETTQELDEFIRQLNEDYSMIKLKMDSPEASQFCATPKNA